MFNFSLVNGEIVVRYAGDGTTKRKSWKLAPEYAVTLGRWLTDQGSLLVAKRQTAEAAAARQAVKTRAEVEKAVATKGRRGARERLRVVKP